MQWYGKVFIQGCMLKEIGDPAVHRRESPQSRRAASGLPYRPLCDVYMYIRLSAEEAAPHGARATANPRLRPQSSRR